jgi:hypothetical protein
MRSHTRNGQHAGRGSANNHRGSKTNKRPRPSLDGDDDPNVNDPNVTIWRAPREKRDQMSRLDRLARMEENGGAGPNKTTNDTAPAVGKKRKLTGTGNNETATNGDNDDDNLDDADLKTEPTTTDATRKDSENATRSKKPNNQNDENEDDDHDAPDEDDWDEEDDYQQGGAFDDDDGYDDEFADEGEGGDAFF